MKREGFLTGGKSYLSGSIMLFSNIKHGAAEGTRTPDPRITNAMLYRLSYRGVTCCCECCAIL
jgi:hypothetical protein